MFINNNCQVIEKPAIIGSGLKNKFAAKQPVSLKKREKKAEDKAEEKQEAEDAPKKAPIIKKKTFTKSSVAAAAPSEETEKPAIKGLKMGGGLKKSPLAMKKKFDTP